MFWHAGVKPNLWLATSPAKRATEILYLIYSPFWMVWALCIVVPFRLYEVGGPDSLLSSSALHWKESKLTDSIPAQLPAERRQCRIHGHLCVCSSALHPAALAA